MNGIRSYGARGALVCALVLMGTVSLASADVPRLISFQGKLDGATTGPVDLEVRLYDAAVGGTLLFKEEHLNVPLNRGVFSIMIGSEKPGGVSDVGVDASELYVAVSVDGDPELTPRTRIGMVPYAAKSNKAEALVIPDTFDAVAAVDSGGNIDVTNQLNFTLDSNALLTAGHDNTIPTRMWIAHSEAFPTWGIQYRDYSSDGYGSDAIEFVGGETATPRFSFETFTGRMVMTNQSGDKNVEIRSRFDSSNTGGWLTVRDGGAERVSLAGRNSDTDAGGLIHIRHSSNTATIRLAGEDSIGTGGEFIMTDAAGDTTVDLDSDVGSGASLSILGDSTNSASAVVQATSSGGAIYLRNAAGANTITLDGDYSGGDGRIVTEELQITGGSDLSEQFDVRGGAIEPGLVVCIDADNPGDLVVSTRPYDRAVAGIISGAGNVKPGMLMGQHGTEADGQHPVALTGRVWVRCDASSGPIIPGDLLTTSNVPGHAMKVTDHVAAQGAIIGKAMTRLEQGTGLVLVLVSLQ